MKQIPLTKGLYAIVDDADYPALSKYRWFASYHGRNGTDKWYAVRSNPKRTRKRNGSHIRMHREILGLKPGDKRIGHHKNENGLDNRKENLEILASNHHNMLYSKNWSRGGGAAVPG